MPRIKLVCEVCEMGFMGWTGQKVCGNVCRKKKNHIEREYKKKIPTGTVGAIQELRVTVDLLGKGYEVFRAISPSCSCDLLVLEGSEMRRLEVRTGYPNYKGTSFVYPKTNIRAENIAVVFHGKINYIGHQFKSLVD